MVFGGDRVPIDFNQILKCWRGAWRPNSLKVSKLVLLILKNNDMWSLEEEPEAPTVKVTHFLFKDHWRVDCRSFSKALLLSFSKTKLRVFPAGSIREV